MIQHHAYFSGRVGVGGLWTPHLAFFSRWEVHDEACRTGRVSPIRHSEVWISHNPSSPPARLSVMGHPKVPSRFCMPPPIGWVLLHWNKNVREALLWSGPTRMMRKEVGTLLAPRSKRCRGYKKSIIFICTCSWEHLWKFSAEEDPPMNAASS